MKTKIDCSHRHLIYVDSAVVKQLPKSTKVKGSSPATATSTWRWKVAQNFEQYCKGWRKQYKTIFFAIISIKFCILLTQHRGNILFFQLHIKAQNMSNVLFIITLQLVRIINKTTL